MKRNVMHSFVEQAEARIAKELSEFEISTGEIPYINSGAIAGRAVDYLRQNNVPVKGYVIDVHILLIRERSPGNEVSMKVKIGEYRSPAEQENTLRTDIAAFEAKNGPVTKWKIVHEIQFLYDEYQISD
mgnify:FL=1